MANSSLFLCIILLLLNIVSIYCCTSILVGPKATIDGSTMTTHNNDCTDCDIRIGVIPAKDYKPDKEKCPIYPCKFGYPRYVGTDRGSTYYPELLESEAPKTKFPISQPLTHIEQVEHTYSYIEGTYPIANEHQLMMGESTCAARFVAYGAPYGDALYDISALQRVAMERCKTARCAIELMGKLAIEGGYYGANDPPETGSGMYEESGESLTIIDPYESWVFHILPDDTGKSAIWAAQKLEDDHFTVVANKFIIRNFDFNDKKNFLSSPGMKEIAVKNGFWPANRTDFDFALAFAPDAGMAPGWADRRTWHLFNWVAPSLGLKPNGPAEFPFSVKAEKKLSIHDIMAMNRDHFEGTEFDLSHNAAAGPYNNPNRYDRMRKPEYAGGYFERAISLHRTSYSFVAQARSWLPAPIGGIVWFAHHAPHSSLFIPLYSATNDLPNSFKTGTVFELRRTNAWWAFAAVANYAEKMYMFIQRDVNKRQHNLEHEAILNCHKQDKLAKDKLDNSAEGYNSAVSIVSDFTVNNAGLQVNEWWKFLDFLFTKYRDGTVLQSFEPPVHAIPQFYPAWWLGRVGYYDRGPMPPYLPVMPEPAGPPHPEFLPKPESNVDKTALKRIPHQGHAASSFTTFATMEELEQFDITQMTQHEQSLTTTTTTPMSLSSPTRVSTISLDSTSGTQISFPYFSIFILLLLVSSGSFYMGIRYAKRNSIDSHEYSTI